MELKNILLTGLVSLLLFPAGCCPTSRVVLLDSGKISSAIVVKTTGGEQVLDQPNTYTTISNAARKPTPAIKLSATELERKYSDLLNFAPQAPVSFMLYFKTNSTELTEVSRQLFPAIEQALHKRAPCNVNIIGHSDRLGSSSFNLKLSLERARRVYQWLQQRQIKIENVEIESYGEKDPLIPTPDGVAEPRNRRVEIMIR